MKRYRSLLSLILSLVMLFSCLPSNVLAVWAEEDIPKESSVIEEALMDEDDVMASSDFEVDDETDAALETEESGEAEDPVETEESAETEESSGTEKGSETEESAAAKDSAAGEEDPVLEEESEEFSESEEITFEYRFVNPAIDPEGEPFPVWNGEDEEDEDEEDELSAQLVEQGIYVSEAAVGKHLREKILLHEDFFKFTFRVDSSRMNDNLVVDLAREILARATAHTGRGNEGDYIYYQMVSIEISGSYGHSSTEKEPYYDIAMGVQVNYMVTKAEDEELTAELKKVYQGLNLENKTDKEKVESIYLYLCKNITYDYESLNNGNIKGHSAYNGLIKKTCVCQGYAALVYRMMLDNGIDCRYLSGRANNDGHAWNMVYLYGSYYLLDATWDASPNAKLENLRWYLRGSNNFPDHELDIFVNLFYLDYPVSETDYVSGTESSVIGKDDDTTKVLKSGNFGNGVNWAVHSSGALVIWGNGEIEDFVCCDVPLLVDGDFGRGWEAYKEQITKVRVLEGIKGIGEHAFEGFHNLTSVSIADSVWRIKENAFAYCRKLTSITMPSSLITLENAFTGCSALMKVTFRSPKEIYGVAEAFDKVTSLKEFVIQGEETGNLRVHEGVLYQPAYGDNLYEGKRMTLVCYPAAKTGTEYTMPDWAEAVGSRAFRNNTSLHKITIAEKVVSVERKAFANSKIKTIIFSGDAPVLLENCMEGISVTIYYSLDKDGWYDRILREQFKGTVTWKPYRNYALGSTVATASGMIFASPKIDHQILGSIAEGEVLSLTGSQSVSTDGETWLQLTSGGWVEAKYVYTVSSKGPSSADRLGKGTTTRKVSFYAYPSNYALELGTIAVDKTYNLYAQSGDWYQAYVNGRYVWLRADGFNYTSSVTITKITTGTMTAETLLYYGPGVSYDTCGTLKEGRAVNVYEIRTVGVTKWYKVYSGGKYVWIDGNFFYDSKTPAPLVSDKIGQGTTTKKVTIYSQPDTTSSVLGTIPADRVRNLYAQSGNWYQIYVTGVGFCWVRCDGFDFTSAIRNASIGKKIVANDTTVYYGPGVDYLPVMKLTEGTVVNYYDQKDEWFLVYRSGKYDWIHASCLKDGYVIEYNRNGGSGTAKKQWAPLNEAVRLREVPYRKAGYRLAGWNTKADGSGTSYQVGELVNPIKGALETVTLYAQWIQTDCTKGHAYRLTNEEVILRGPLGEKVSATYTCAICGASKVENEAHWYTDADTTAVVNEIIELINKERIRAGIEPLSVISKGWNDYAYSLAVGLADDFDYNRWARYEDEHFMMGEGIACMAVSGKEFYQMLHDSYEDRASFMDKTFDGIAVAVYVCETGSYCCVLGLFPYESK